MTKSTTITDRQEKEKHSLIGILKEMPIIEVACKKAGIGRATYYRWRQEDKQFRRESEDALDQGREYINDMSESQLITLIKEKKMPAIAMWLKHNHKRYGAKIRPYAAGAPTEDLTPQENMIMLEALALASGNTIDYETNNSSISTTDQGEPSASA